MYLKFYFFSFLYVQEQGTKFLSRKVLRNIIAERHYDYIFTSDIRASTAFQIVIVLAFE